MVKIANKGYTLEVVSWENDADNYRTKFITIDDKSKAIAIAKLLTKLCVSEYIGNSNSCDEYDRGLSDFYEDHCDEFWLTDLDSEIRSEKDFINYMNRKGEDYIYSGLGNSEYYNCRICESVDITYLEEDIFATSILF